jgi:hypothetical protein
MGVICNTAVDVVGYVTLLQVQLHCLYTVLHRSIIVPLNIVSQLVFIIDIFLFWEEGNNFAVFYVHTAV